MIPQATSVPASPLSRAHPWDLVASEYARDLAPHCGEYASDALALAPLSAGARVLDLAAGPGTLSLLAAKQGLSVTAVDFSNMMIAELRERAVRAGVSERVEARVGDGQALPEDIGRFDAAFSIFGLIFFADRECGLREIRRVLVPGGRAVVVSWAPLEAVPEIRKLFAALRRAVPELTIPSAPAPLGSGEEMQQALLAAGFRRVQVHSRSHDLFFQSASDFWHVFARSAAPVVLVRERVGEARWGAISASVVPELVAEFAGVPVVLSMPAYFGVGER